jgi:hypothetical protein
MPNSHKVPAGTPNPACSNSPPEQGSVKKKKKKHKKKSKWVLVVTPSDPETMVYSSDTEETPSIFRKIGKVIVKAVKFIYLS